MGNASDPPPDRYRRYLLFLAQLHVAPRLRAKFDLEGLVQQTLVDAWRAGSALAEASRAAWLRQVLARNLADEYRRLTAGKRDVGRERSLDAALAESSARLAGVLAADQSSPSDRVARDEQTLRVVDALDQLPDAQREAHVLQHWQGWSLAAIGEHLGRSPAAVAGLIERGLKQLRTLLENDAPGQREEP